MIRLKLENSKLSFFEKNININKNKTEPKEENTSAKPYETISVDANVNDILSFQNLAFLSIKKQNAEKEQICANQSDNNTRTKTKTATKADTGAKSEADAKAETEADVKTKTEVNKSNNNIFSNNSDKTILINNFFKTEESKETEKSNETTDTTTENSEKPKETAPTYTPTVAAIPTSQEDIEAIWTEITKAHGAIANFTPTLSYSASNFYAQLSYMVESDNPVVKQFAEMFKNTFDSLNLDQASGAALMERITANMQEKVYGKGIGISIGLLMEEPLKDCLEKLDTDKDGSIFDELDMIIQEEVSKVKNFTKEEIENATTMDIEKLLNLTGEESNNAPFGAISDDSIDTSYILKNLPDMLLCDEAGVRKFANMLTSLFNEYGAFDDETKEKLIGKLFDEMNYQSSLKSWEESQGKPLDERTYIGVKPKAIYYTNGSFINKDELQNFDLDNDGNMFDDIENIINSEEFDKRCKSMTNDFWDTDTMFDWATMYLATSSEEATATKNSLTYEELFKLATNESWNDENNNIFGMIWRNVDEIDKNKDGKISKEEMQTVVGECTSRTSLRANILDLDDTRASEYEKLSSQEKLDKVIEEAKRYCTMMGWDDYLEVLNGHGGHWKISVGKTSSDTANGTCYKMDHLIRISPKHLENADFETAVGTLMHELTHATHTDMLNSIEQENDCDQVKENYLDSVGLGKYGKADEESVNIDTENSNTPAYKDLPRSQGTAGKIIGGIGKGIASAYNWIKGWF